MDIDLDADLDDFNTEIKLDASSVTTSTANKNEQEYKTNQQINNTNGNTKENGVDIQLVQSPKTSTQPTNPKSSNPSNAKPLNAVTPAGVANILSQTSEFQSITRNMSPKTKALFFELRNKKTLEKQAKFDRQAQPMSQTSNAAASSINPKSKTVSTKTQLFKQQQQQQILIDLSTDDEVQLESGKRIKRRKVDHPNTSSAACSNWISPSISSATPHNNNNKSPKVISLKSNSKNDNRDASDLIGSEDFISLSKFSTFTNNNSNQKRQRDLPFNVKRQTLTDTELSEDPQMQLKQLISSNPTPWVQHDYSEYSNLTHRLHEELIDFVTFISPTHEEHQQRLDLIESVVKLISKSQIGNKYPNFELKCFGSFETKTYLPISDLDLVLITNSQYELTKNEIVVVLNCIAAEVQKGQASFVEVVQFARIPIVKFTDKRTTIKVDISVDVTSGLEGSVVIKNWLVERPILRPLLLFLKYFLYCRGLNETYTGGVGSFLLILMCLCCINQVYLYNDCNLGSLLLAFFDMYGNQLNYKMVGLKIHIDGMSSSFYRKDVKGRLSHDRPQLLSIENPFDGDHDVGQNSYGIMKIRRAFQICYQVITQYYAVVENSDNNNKSSSNSKRKNRRQHESQSSQQIQIVLADHEEGQVDDKKSLLGKIISLTEEILTVRPNTASN